MRQTKMTSKYVVFNTWSDYDCGSPCARLVDDKMYDTWQDAYDAMVKDILDAYEVSSVDDLEYEHDIPPRDKEGAYTHKCATAWVYDDDGESLWRIHKIGA